MWTVGRNIVCGCMKANVRSEEKNVQVLQEKLEVIRVGFTEKMGNAENKSKAAKVKKSETSAGKASV